MLSSYKQFYELSSVPVRLNESLSKHTTFKVGGSADLFVEIKSRQDLVDVLGLVKKIGIKYFFLGGGSNIVFKDKGFRGVVVKYSADSVIINKKSAEVDAGIGLNQMVLFLAKRKLGGIDFLGNIPGSLGGAIVGNAGCYGKEVKDILKSIELFNINTGEFVRVTPDELGFGYRYSNLKKKNNLIVVSAVLNLKPVKYIDVSKAVIAEKQARNKKHPHKPSAGSFFKNPSRKLPAWQLIEKAGMKGIQLGGAKISNKHANFLINHNKATAKDIFKLSQLVKNKVEKTTGVKLMKEIKFVN